MMHDMWWYGDGCGWAGPAGSWMRRIHLKGLRNTSVSLMLASGIPVHVVAAWHGDAPAVSPSIHPEAQRDELAPPRRRRRTLRVGIGVLTAGWDLPAHWHGNSDDSAKQETRSDPGQSGFSLSG